MAIGEARSLGHDAVHFSQIASCKGTREPDQTTRYPREGFDPLRGVQGHPVQRLYGWTYFTYILTSWRR